MATAPFRMEFERKFEIKNGAPVSYDVVHLYQPGMSQRSKTPIRISEVSKVRLDGDPDNPAWLAAKTRWDTVRPAYEAWQRGQEMPVEGTPLGAWPGITAEQGAAIRAVGLLSVEDLANATDAILQRIQLPNVRGLKDLAIAYTASADKSKIAADLAAKDRELAEMRSQMEELRQMLVEQMQREPELEPDGTERPRRGRPPKVREDETHAT